MAQKRLTHKEFMERVKKAGIKDVIVLGKYVVAKEKILVKCANPECGHEWKIYPNNLLKGQKCPICSRKKRGLEDRLTKKEFLERVKKYYPNIKIIGEYKTTKDNIQCECRKCHAKFFIKASRLTLPKKYTSADCPICRPKTRKKTRLSPNIFSKRVKKINPHLKLLEKYETRRKKIMVKCKKCGYEWKVLPGNILKKYGCPNCKGSVGEKKVEQILKSKNIKFIKQYRFVDCKDKYLLPFDFYLPNFNMCIEYDGQLHFQKSGYSDGQKKLEYAQKHDKIKNKYCIKKGIFLLRIPYTEYNNIEEIISDMLSKIKGGDA